MSEILLIDKPSGPTSHDIVNRVRRSTGVKRVGHAGTLDPLASGLLIVLVGRDATKQQATFLHMDKTYDCTAELGVTSETYDITGHVQKAVSWPVLRQLTQAQLQTVLREFEGTIAQRVPAFSAVKVHGQKLYQKARHHELSVAELPVKTITIFTIKLLSFSHDELHKKVFFSVQVHCSSGTYIRSLIHDIGEKLEVGAVVTALRRLQIGPYDIKYVPKQKKSL